MGVEINRKGRCVRQAIMAVQHVFADEGSFKDAYHKIEGSLHDRRMEALSLEPNWQHAVAFSTVGMIGIVFIEWLRAQNIIHLPGLIQVLNSTPLVSASIMDTKLSPPVLSPSAHSPVLEDQPKIPPLDHHQEYGPEEWAKNFDKNFPQNSHE